MSNSPLISYTRISPNSSPRTDIIRKITPHHTAGRISVESLGEIFAPASRKASANYGIGFNGRIALFVDESRSAWTSSSSANDNQAVTIEVSNESSGGDWPVSDLVFESLVKLCVDICQRNKINGLIYTGASDGTLTHHNMFAATACPGPYLQRNMALLAQRVNEVLIPKIPEAIADRPSPWAVDAWAWATGLRLPNGAVFMDDRMPQGPVTREMMAALFYRFAMLDVGDGK